MIESKLEISAWRGNYQVDEHICELFPELSTLGLEDLTEGSMEYNEVLSKEELILMLNSMGFNAIAIDSVKSE